MNTKPTINNIEDESLKETLDIISDKKLTQSIKQGEEDLNKGKFVTLEELVKQLSNIQTPVTISP